MQRKSRAQQTNQLKIRSIALVALSILVSNTVAAPANSADTYVNNANLESHGGNAVRPAKRISHDKTVLAKATAESKDSKPRVINLNLTKLRDTGLAIRQIRQQALNIYLEATRKEITPTDKCAIADPVPENVDTAKESCGAYLPPRKEWLVVYLTAIEPVSQLLRKWQGNLTAGSVVRTVPKGTATKYRPVNKQFFEEALKIEKQLDALHDIFESEQSDNAKLAEVSKGLLHSATNLEKLREQEFEILKEAALKGVKETEVL